MTSEKYTLTLGDIYSQVLGYGYFVRVSKLNGLAMWGLLKDNLSNVFGKDTFEWNIPNDQITGEYNQLDTSGFIGHKDKTDEMDTHQWESEHFLVQHIRILKESPKPTVVKILQVAYNTGQLVGEMESGSEFYKKFIKRVVDYPSADSPLKLGDIVQMDRYISTTLQNTQISELVKNNNMAKGLSIAGGIFKSIVSYVEE